MALERPAEDAFLRREAGLRMQTSNLARPTGSDQRLSRATSQTDELGPTPGPRRLAVATAPSPLIT
jgi:hypothetical protein